MIRPTLAELTNEENRAWEIAFCFYVENDGLTDSEADRRAWSDTVAQFPRLAAFDGAKP